MNLISKLLEIAVEKGQICVLATVIFTDQSTPRKAGSKMIIQENAIIHGSIGGGAIEKQVIDHALAMMQKGIDTSVLNFNLQSGENKGIDTGMICGGEMAVFLERYGVCERLIIYGCGHICSALVPMALECGFSVTAVDDRDDFARKERFPVSTHVVHDHPVTHAEGLQFCISDSLVLITHKHKFDGDILETLLRKPEPFPRYIGMIGSARKAKSTLSSLGKKGIPQERLQQVHAPIGLDIGADNPMEIAVSIMSEVLAVRSGKIRDGTVQNMKRFKLNSTDCPAC